MITIDYQCLLKESACPDSNDSSCSSIPDLSGQNDQELSVSYTLLIESGCKIHKDTLKRI